MTLIIRIALNEAIIRIQFKNKIITIEQKLRKRKRFPRDAENTHCIH